MTATRIMGIRRFRTQRAWHNTLLMVWAIPFALLPGIIVGASMGQFLLFQVLALFSVIGLVVAIRRDRVKNCHYVMGEDQLWLVKNSIRRRIHLPDIIDASPIERSSAREYLKMRSEGSVKPNIRTAEGAEPFLRYCTVDIGITSYTLGFGRAMIDKLPQAKTDLVLLRLQHGEDLLLSPVHMQDLVDALGKRQFLA